MAHVFLTGGTGFLGGATRDALMSSRGEDAITELPRARGADLLNSDSYHCELVGACAVVHLAAATGRASEAEHFRTNVEGTRTLLDQCRRAGVPRFLFVSSIATTFGDIRRYPYARAKLAAEVLVAQSGLDYTIVRPTIITGPGSPVLGGLRKLATLPVVPVFGTGQVRVQPIMVTDLANCLAEMVDDHSTSGQMIELGGPEVVSIEELLAAIRRVLKLGDAHYVHLPLGPIIAGLVPLERIAGGVLPLTIGQLATFRYDGVASPSPVFERHRASMTGLLRMLELSFAR